MKLTTEFLKSLDACQTHVELFVRLFPDGAEITPETLARAHAGGLDVVWLAGNPATPPEALGALASDGDAYVRWGVARNPATPPATLGALASDRDADVRWGVAGNPATPPETLVALASDGDASVRRDVARHPATPPEALVALASDGDASVRRDVYARRVVAVRTTQ
jgi:hypothetical protein